MRSLPATRLLGLSIHLDRSRKQLFINQSNFVKKILAKFNMDTCNAITTPADPCSRISAQMLPSTEEEKLDMSNLPYREAVGCLLYLSITCRPDISFVVSQVAKFCQNPGRAHWIAVKRVLSHLARTDQFGVYFGPSTAEPRLVGYTDADYDGDLDSRCSTSGFAFFVRGILVSWSSRRQNCVSQSTTEIKSIHNPEFHQRTKHIDVRYHFIRQLQEDGIIDATYVPSKEQKADIFTKPLPKSDFKRMRKELGVDGPLAKNRTD
jgi:hypothetical protein